MNNIFNTPFENSLRLLLLLSVDSQNAKSADMLSALDFITVYGGSLGVSENDLNGSNPFGFSELAARREVIFYALKQLAIKGFVLLEPQKNGFYYTISVSGGLTAASLSSGYAKQYLAAARTSFAFTEGKTEQQLFDFINKQAALALKTK